MTTTLVLPDRISASLAKHAACPRETAGVLLARAHLAANGDLRLLGRAIHWIPQQHYHVRTATRMSIASDGYIRPLRHAEEDGAIPIWVHTHPGGNPLPSDHDEVVDRQIRDVFRLRSGSKFYGTVIAAPQTTGLALTGTLTRGRSAAVAIDRFWLVGDRWRLVQPYDRQSPEPDAMFDRNVRAFGTPIQRAISMLQIAVVGAGGTGSAVAEQLVRLGARHLLLVDADSLSKSNVTRVYGSTESQVGQPKVDVLSEHLRRISPTVCCEPIRGICTAESVARSLANVDLVFGCTDDNAGRLVLSRLSTYYLTPVIDMGILISSGTGDVLSGIDGRITTLTPGSPCLVCRDRVDLTRAAAEQKTPEERQRLADEGYAPALGFVEPAVVPFTTMVAAAAVGELLERLIGYGPSSRPSEVLLRIHDREVSTNNAEPRQGHYCHPASGKQGIGDTDPFMEQIWKA